MGFVRRVLALPARTRVLASAAVFLVALLASAVGQATGIDAVGALGFVLFPWGVGFTLMWLGDHFFEQGRSVLYEEFHRGPVWLFVGFIGWSIAYVQFAFVPGVLVVYELLVGGTALGLTLVMVAVRTWTDLDVGPVGRVPSRRATVVRLLPLALVFGWVYARGTWTVTSTVALGLAMLVGLVVVFRPEWIPGVPARVSEE